MLRMTKMTLLGLAAMATGLAQDGVIFFNNSSSACVLTFSSGILNFRDNHPDLNFTSVVNNPDAQALITAHLNDGSVTLQPHGGHVLVKTTDPARSNRVHFSVTRLGGQDLGRQKEVSFTYQFSAQANRGKWLEWMQGPEGDSESSVNLGERQALAWRNSRLLELHDRAKAHQDAKDAKDPKA